MMPNTFSNLLARAMGATADKDGGEGTRKCSPSPGSSAASETKDDEPAGEDYELVGGDVGPDARGFDDAGIPNDRGGQGMTPTAFQMSPSVMGDGGRQHDPDKHGSARRGGADTATAWN